MTKATYKVLVDWDNDGDFGDTGEDITADTIELSTVRGRDFASQLTGKSRAGTLMATLENSNNTYNSFNTGSAIAGNILPGRKVQLQTGDSFPYAFPIVFSDTPIWTGYLDRIDPQPAIHGNHRAVLRATGPLGRIAGKKIRVATKSSRLTSDAIGDILNDTGWAAGDRDIQTGQTTLTKWWVDDLKAISALREVEESESGFIWEKADGKIAFDDRHFRTTNGNSVTSQKTLTDTAGSNIEYSQVDQKDPLKEIYNIIEATVKGYTVGPLAVLWTLSESGANSPSIAPGDSRTWWARHPSPDSATDAVGVDAWTTTAATTDMTANSQAGGGGTDLTGDITIAVEKFGNVMKITLTNTAAVAASITLLQARGTPITADDPVKIVAEDATSQAAFDERTYPLPAPWIPTTDEALDYVNFILSIFKDPIPVLSISIAANRDQSHMAESLIRDIDDRVTVVATGGAGLGINEDFFVEAIRHRIDKHRNQWTTYDLSPATAFGGFWILGTSELGTGTKLAY